MYSIIEIYWNGNEDSTYIIKENIENIQYSICKKYNLPELKRKTTVKITIKLNENENSQEVQKVLTKWGLCKSKEVYSFYKNLKIREIIDDTQYRFISFYFLGIEKFEQNEKEKQLILTLSQREDKLSWVALNDGEDKILDDKYASAYQAYLLAKNKKEEKIEEEVYRFHKLDGNFTEIKSLTEEELIKYLENGFRFKNISN